MNTYSCRSAGRGRAAMLADIRSHRAAAAPAGSGWPGWGPVRRDIGAEMDVMAMTLDCPAYMDRDGDERCGLPATVEYRYTMESTDGPLESAKIRCPSGHSFNGPIESLTWDK